MQGTTTACYFASLYSTASVILGRKAANIGQRALIGKITMNVERSDEYYETTEESIKNMRKFIESISEIDVCPKFLLNLYSIFSVYISFYYNCYRVLL